jgi:hypothetical protein
MGERSAQALSRGRRNVRNPPRHFSTATKIRPINLFRETRAQFSLFRFAIFIQAPHIDEQLLLQLFGFFKLLALLRFHDFVFQEHFALGDFRFARRIDFRELLLLLVR